MIKMEPHKPSKIAEDRLRLISVFALEDQMVDRCLFTSQLKTEVRNPFSQASKSGWTPMPEGFHELISTFPGETLATDCSAFDWTFPSWLVDVILEARLDATRSVSEDYATAVRSRWHEVLGTRCVLRLPSGHRYRQVKAGLMKSGWLLTISVNSEAQEYISRIAWMRSRKDEFPAFWAMGDDVLMSWRGGDPSRFIKRIRELGILTKMHSFDREFSGFLFSKGALVVPLYPDKHKFILAHTPSDALVEIISNYGLLYALAGESWVDPLLAEYGRWSKRTCRAWALGLLAPGLRPAGVDAFRVFHGFW